MKKIYSIKERLIYILAIAILSTIQLILLIYFNDKLGIVIIAYTCIAFIVLFLAKLIYFPFHIVVNKDRIKVFDFPLLATNKFYDKKRSLILWNSEINIDEVKDVELVKLTKDEKIKYIGFNHLFDQYIRVTINNSNSAKYIYASAYSDSQVKEIIDVLRNSKSQAKSS